MGSLVHRVEGDVPPLAGTPGLVQGVYGRRGNLELVAPDPEDGLWVFWFNNDEPESEPAPGARPGCWSAGLRFARGRRYEAAAIVQSRHGPDWLEVAATAEGLLRRFTWRPETGFTEEGDSWPAVGPAAAVETSDWFLHVAAAQPGSGVAIRSTAGTERLVATETLVSGVALLLPDAELMWADGTGVHAEGGFVAPGRAPAAATDPRTGERHVAWIDDGRVHRQDGDGPDLRSPAEAIAVAVSHVERPRLELVIRTGTVVWHARLDLQTGAWSPAALIG